MSTILLITQNFPPSSGGVQHYLFNTVMNLRDTTSAIICGRGEDDSFHIDMMVESRGNKVYRVDYIPENRGMRNLFTSFREILKMHGLACSVARKERISLFMIGHASLFNLVVMYLMSLTLQVPRAVLFHGEDIPDMPLKSNSFRRWLIRKADFHICNSMFTYNRLLGFCHRIDRGFIAFPGVDERFFRPADTASLCARYGTEGRRTLVTVGRLDPRKGHDLVIDALPDMIRKAPDLLYLIGGNGGERSRLEQKVAAAGLQNHVIFCGFIPDDEIVSFHQLADVFVMPNRMLADGDTEGFGIVFLEAGACGKPVIGGACGGALDAVVDGVTGYLVDPNQTGELAERVIHLLSHPEVAAELGRNGRSRAWESFRWPHLAAKLENFLNTEVFACPS